MNFAIIAAGEGSRLRKEGFDKPKPMVRLEGEMLVERLIRIFKDNGAESINIIINAHSPQLEAFLIDLKAREPLLNLIIKSTLSSAHSFYSILGNIGFENKELCLTTVDTIFDEEVFKEYISAFVADKTLDALMATTSYVDDEKPLWVSADDEGMIKEYSSEQRSPRPLVSGGIYCLRAEALSVAKSAMEQNVSRMRNYQQMLVEKGCKVKSFEFAKILDIDHVGDIDKAKAFLEIGKRRVLFVERAKRFSPSCEQKDERLFDNICSCLRAEGIRLTTVCEDDLEKVNPLSFDLILSMARSEKALDILSNCETAGIRVVNSVKGSRNCFRESMNELLRQSGVMNPRFIITDGRKKKIKGRDNKTDSRFDFPLQDGVWVKRADFQTETKDDVVFCKDSTSLDKAVETLNRRGIDKVLICEHIVGRLVKLYRISGTPFCEYFAPSEDKFGENLHQTTDVPDLDRAKLVSLSDKVAEVLGLEVFGMDIIENEKGECYIIDVNDFPSFSNYSQEAAKHICNKTLSLCKEVKR